MVAGTLLNIRPLCSAYYTKTVCAKYQCEHKEKLILSGYSLLEIGGADAGGALEANDFFAVVFAPLFGDVESAALVVLAEGESVKVDAFEGFDAEAAINNYLINFFDAFKNFDALLGGIENLGVRLVLFDFIAVLYGHNEIIAVFFALLKEP